jgi:hypothetical protein
MTRVRVTYAGSPSLLAEQWEGLRTSISAQMPLRNLHWKSLARPSVRTIQELDVDLVALDMTEPSSQMSSPLLDQPLLNIYFSLCDASITLPLYLVNFYLIQIVYSAFVSRTSTRTRISSESRFKNGIAQLPNAKTKSGFFSWLFGRIPRRLERGSFI